MRNYFFYSLVFVSLASCRERSNEEASIAQKAIKKTYQEWVYKKVKNREYWYESKWQAELDKRPNKLYIENCKEGLPDDFNRIHYGDINLDGKLDGIATIVPLPCDGGTAHRFESKELFFISGNENYTLIDDPQVVISSIGITGEVDTIINNGVIIYTARDYGDNDGMCCPSKEWKVKFKYMDAGFKKIK